ncbi:MAG: EAL domain-containing protein [Bradymonadia bacterium]
MEFRRKFAAGEIIFEEGDVGDCAYVVEHGKVEIFAGKRNTRVQLATRTGGDLFGEMAIIDDEPRSAGARAMTDTTLLIITRDQLNQRIERADPILRMCMNVLLSHLRDTLRRLTQRNTLEFDRPLINDEALSQALSAIRLEQALQTALDQDQFELWYQPIVDLQDGQIAGYEALIRWRHPERGLIYPGAFIGAAERCGLIIPMTRWAFQQACTDLGALGTDRFVSVNFSGKDFAAPDFLAYIDATLAALDRTPSQLKLEITESLLMHSPETARRVLKALRQRGASVAIDDFGTGYSSLSYLHSLPADTLKIDRSFVQSMLVDESSHSLVRSIIGLAQGLDMTIVAEGIEEPAQGRALRDMGVQLAQGFFFARPAPLAHIVSLTEQWVPKSLAGSQDNSGPLSL